MIIRIDFQAISIFFKNLTKDKLLKSACFGSLLRALGTRRLRILQLSPALCPICNALSQAGYMLYQFTSLLS